MESFSQYRYALLDRAYRKPVLYQDSVTKDDLRNGYFPIYADQIDSLQKFVEVFTKYNKLGLKRTYFLNEDYQTSSISFKIKNVQHAYGDLYDIDVISKTDFGETILKLGDAAETVYFNHLYIRGFNRYLKNEIKRKQKKGSK